VAYYRLAGAPAAATATENRCVAYVFSTGAVARDNHTINQAGWKMEAYRSNPVFLFCHDSSAPPIGQVVEIGVTNGALRGIVQYADAETYNFADVVFRLVKGRYLNAASVSWNPIKFTYTTDRSRPGGIDFQEQELLEISQVPVPSDTAALATARAAGIDTGPLAAWAERALDLRKALPIGRTELTALYRGARMPLAPVRRISDAIRSDTQAWRREKARAMAYEGAELGVPLPAWALPARDRREREMILKGHRLHEREGS
jgi:hypothetical protein